MNNLNTFGCKHSKVDQESAPYTKVMIFLVKRLLVVAKCCLKYVIFHDDFYC